jgi:hydroxycarboxylate dehydrogenase B
MIIDHVRLLALANRIVTAGGSSPAEAAIVAEHLVEANLRSETAGSIQYLRRNDHQRGFRAKS